MDVCSALSIVSDQIISTVRRLTLLLVMTGALEGLQRAKILRHDAFIICGDPQPSIKSHLRK